MKLKVLFRHDSDVLNCSYRFGRTADGQCVYVWTDRSVEDDEIPADALADPEANHGAIIGDCDTVRDEYENCVGCLRDFENPEAEEAHVIVDGANEVLVKEFQNDAI